MYCSFVLSGLFTVKQTFLNRIEDGIKVSKGGAQTKGAQRLFEQKRYKTREHNNLNF